MKGPPQGATFETVWASFQETDRQLKEVARQQKETDRLLKETDQIVKETARRQKETDRLLKETDQIVKENARRQKETDRQMKETDRQMKETDRRLGEMGNRFGELSEHLLTSGIVEKFRALNFAFTKAGPNLKFTDSQGRVLAEVDMWLENGELILAMEVKSFLRVEHVKDHVRRMRLLRGYADERQDPRKLLGAVAGAVVKAPARDYAFKQGFYVIEPSGDTVKISAPEGFTPRLW
jgi:hypothetical protein